MAKVIVYGAARNNPELLDLLDAAGCEVVGEESFFDDVHDTEDMPEALIVVLAPEIQEDEELEEHIVRAVNENCVVTGIWPKGVTEGKIPGPILKYGTNKVTWDVDKVRAVVCGESGPRNDAPTGKPAESAEFQRNKC